MKKIDYIIYSLTPAPWGDDYRFVESFTYEEDAMRVLETLEVCNVSNHVYKIVEWERE